MKHYRRGHTGRASGQLPVTRRKRRRRRLADLHSAAGRSFLRSSSDVSVIIGPWLAHWVRRESSITDSVYDEYFVPCYMWGGWTFEITRGWYGGDTWRRRIPIRNAAIVRKWQRSYRIPKWFKREPEPYFVYRTQWWDLRYFALLTVGWLIRWSCAAEPMRLSDVPGYTPEDLSAAESQARAAHKPKPRVVDFRLHRGAGVLPQASKASPAARAATPVNMTFVTEDPAQCARKAIPLEFERQNRLVAERLLEDAYDRVGRPFSPRSPSLQDKFLGSVLGCAVGEALGAANLFLPWGTFDFVSEFLGSVRCRCRPGDWAVGTSTLLCLLDSLVASGGIYDAEDLQRRLRKWLFSGENTPYGVALNPGVHMQRALEEQLPPMYPDYKAVGTGSLMRVAPGALLYWRDLPATRAFCAQCSLVTHAATEAQQLCALFGEMIARAIAAKSTADKSLVWAVDVKRYNHLSVIRLAEGSWMHERYPSYEWNGNAKNALRAVLWCFKHTRSFDECVFAAANIGDDASTTAALAGQLAGAFYGVSVIRQSWLDRLAHSDKIRRAAMMLYAVAESGGGKTPGYITIPQLPPGTYIPTDEVVQQVDDERLRWHPAYTEQYRNALEKRVSSVRFKPPRSWDKIKEYLFHRYDVVTGRAIF